MCVLRVVSVTPYLKTLAVSCQPTLWFGIVTLTQAPGSAITLPPVTAPADMLALNHGLMRLSFVVAPVLPRAMMQSPWSGTSKLHAGRVHVVGGICVIAGQRVLADPAMQIAVAQNVT